MTQVHNVKSPTIIEVNVKGNTKQEKHINHTKAKNIATHEDPNLVSFIATFHKNTMLIKIGDQKTQALVDTGASIS